MKISVILSTHNGVKYIQESIDSVLKQSFQNFEFIIINDYSTDTTESIILDSQKKDSRIIYIKNNKNLGLAYSLNKGLKKARGQYIARIDDDDIWIDENKLRKQLEFMEKNLGYGLCGSSVITIDEKGLQNKVNMKKNDREIRMSLLKSNQFVHSSILIRTSILKKVGGYYNPNFNGSEDYELWLRIGKNSSFFNIQDYLVGYRILSTSISNKKVFNQELQTLKATIKHRNSYPRFLKSFFLRLGYSTIRIFRINNLLKKIFI